MKALFRIVIAALLSLAVSNAMEEKVWIIIGSGVNLKCSKAGCISQDAYWTGTEKVYANGFPSGWSDNWQDAKQYTAKDPDPNFDVPNGRHCCYSETPTPIDPKTGKEAW